MSRCCSRSHCPLHASWRWELPTATSALAAAAVEHPGDPQQEQQLQPCPNMAVQPVGCTPSVSVLLRGACVWNPGASAVAGRRRHWEPSSVSCVLSIHTVDTKHQTRQRPLAACRRPVSQPSLGECCAWSVCGLRICACGCLSWRDSSVAWYVPGHVQGCQLQVRHTVGGSMSYSQLLGRLSASTELPGASCSRPRNRDGAQSRHGGACCVLRTAVLHC